MRQEYKDEALEIFRKLVAAKRSGSLMASGNAYTDLNQLADHVAGGREPAGEALMPEYGVTVAINYSYDGERETLQWALNIFVREWSWSLPLSRKWAYSP